MAFLGYFSFILLCSFSSWLVAVGSGLFEILLRKVKACKTGKKMETLKKGRARKARKKMKEHKARLKRKDI